MGNRRKRRTANDIEKCIINAAIEIIEEEGFQNITVRGIAKKAQIEAVVFYNRYNNLDNFIDEFVKEYDYWFSNVAKDSLSISNLRVQYVSILKSLFNSLKSNKLMQQLLKWELSDSNDITRRTAKLRELHTLPLVEKYKKLFSGSDIEIDTLSALIIGGIYYLILHAELTPFGNIDINSESGSKKINESLDYLGNLFFDNMNTNSKILEIAKRMKKDGVDNKNIIKYTGIPSDTLDKL